MIFTILWIIFKIVWGKRVAPWWSFIGYSGFLLIFWPFSEIFRNPRWLRKWLQRAGVKEGDVVLDEGFGMGTSLIAATRLVGPRGKVYALDNEPVHVVILWLRAKMKLLKNLIQDMLREHLRNDNLWKILSRREKVFSAHRSERIMLQRMVVSILKEETGYEIVDSDVPEPFLYSYTAGDLFFRMTLRWAFGNKNTDWQDKVIADKTSGTVKYLNSILAEARGAEAECRKKLLEAFDKMKILPEATRVVDSYKELEEETLRARRAVEEILVLGLIPGQCRVCRRLGI